jgi:uncharacterized membrane protein
MSQGIGPMDPNMAGYMSSRAGMANMPGVMGNTGIEGFLTSILTIVLPLVVGVLIIAGTVFLVDIFKNWKPFEAKSADSWAVKIVKFRFAKGEINREKY